MDKNRRTARRTRYNRDFLAMCADAELYYVYALVDSETRTIGYIGTANDPVSRYKQHTQYDLGRAPNSVKAQWVSSLNANPDLVIMAMCPTRANAEVIERALIEHYEVTNLIHQWKYVRSRNGALLQHREDDEMPFMVD